MQCLSIVRLRAVTVALLLTLSPLHVRAAEVGDSLDVVSKTNRSAVASQEKIDKISRETRDLLEEYRKLQDGSEYQAAYTRELEDLDRSQQQRIGELRQEIAQVRITRQRIVPLMRSMADALEKFVVLDLPFHHEDRINAVLQLKERLNRPELSASAKFRLLLEVWVQPGSVARFPGIPGTRAVCRIPAGGSGGDIFPEPGRCHQRLLGRGTGRVD
jgi:cell division protein FtsB